MTAAEKPWAPFDYFLGDWQGTGSGGPGESKVTRCYRLTLQGKFIQIKDQSDYPPQEKNLDGELHENLSMLSYDSGRECYVLREFHVEGFVNQYVLDVYEPGERFVFLTESIENIGPGWRARTTYEILGPDHFRETFDLAGPDKPWACFITNELHRAASSA